MKNMKNENVPGDNEIPAEIFKSGGPKLAKW